MKKIDHKDYPRIEITENIDVGSIGTSANIKITSKYYGSKADDIRYYFNSQTRESIERDYLDFYSSLYPGIRKDKDIIIIDQDRQTSNIIVVQEFYSVDEFWLGDEEDDLIYFEVYPIVLETYMYYSGRAERETPFYLGNPFSFFQSSIVNLPEDWWFEPYSNKIEGEGFDYHTEAKCTKRVITINHSYDLTEKWLPPEKVVNLIKQQDQVMAELSYEVTYSKTSEDFKLSYVSIIIFVVAAGAGIWFFAKINRKYDPPSRGLGAGLSIGGWMILPLIGSVISTIVMIVRLFTDEYFNHSYWVDWLLTEPEAGIGIVIYNGVDLFVYVLLIIFEVFILMQFLQRRTSLVRLITISYIIWILYPFLDFIIADGIFPSYIMENEAERVGMQLPYAVLN